MRDDASFAHRDGSDPCGAGRRTAAVARRMVHIHATPAAVVAEMDARSRDLADRLATARRDARAAPVRERRAIVEASDRGGPASLQRDPDPSPSREEPPPIDPVNRPRPAPDGIDPAATEPGLPGGVPGGPPEVPRAP